MEQFKTVFWDFDGVWSKDVFYKSLIKTHPHVWEFIQTQVWGSGVEKWMRGELTMDDINRHISNGTGLDFDVITKTFLEDVAQMKIETRHTPIVQALKKQGVSVGMITNNMDVFNTVTRPRLKLDDLFDGVFDSFSYKKMKAEGLFDIAMQSLGSTDYSVALLIDDSPRARDAFEVKGGNTYAYSTFEDFKAWANKNLLNS
jgi:FMN phosphatase YigB (HAD superfamily)